MFSNCSNVLTGLNERNNFAESRRFTKRDLKNIDNCEMIKEQKCETEFITVEEQLCTDIPEKDCKTVMETKVETQYEEECGMKEEKDCQTITENKCQLR